MLGLGFACSINIEQIEHFYFSSAATPVSSHLKIPSSNPSHCSISHINVPSQLPYFSRLSGYNPAKFGVASWDQPAFSAVNLHYRSPTGSFVAAGSSGHVSDPNSYLDWSIVFNSASTFNSIHPQSDFGTVDWLEVSGSKIFSAFQDTSGNIRAYIQDGSVAGQYRLTGNINTIPAPLGTSIAASVHIDSNGAGVVNIYWLNGTNILESVYSGSSRTFSVPTVVVSGGVLGGSSLSATVISDASDSGHKNIFASTSSGVGVWTAPVASLLYGGPLILPFNPSGTPGFAAGAFARGSTQQIFYGAVPAGNGGTGSISEYFQATNLVWSQFSSFAGPANSNKLAVTSQTTNGQQTILVYYTNSTGLIQRTWSSLHNGGDWFNPFVVPC